MRTERGVAFHFMFCKKLTPTASTRRQMLTQRLDALQFLKPEHLDIPQRHRCALDRCTVEILTAVASGHCLVSQTSQSVPRCPCRSEAAWLLAQKELLKMNQYKAPRDKLVRPARVVLGGCSGPQLPPSDGVCSWIGLAGVRPELLQGDQQPPQRQLRSRQPSGARRRSPPSRSAPLPALSHLSHLTRPCASPLLPFPQGADDFLPVLVYVTLRANPPQLASNVAFISRYRRGSRLVSEAAYFFTNLVSAATFLERADAKAFTVGWPRGASAQQPLPVRGDSS